MHISSRDFWENINNMSNMSMWLDDRMSSLEHVGIPLLWYYLVNYVMEPSPLGVAFALYMIFGLLMWR